MKTAIYILIENEIPIYVGKSRIPDNRKYQHKKVFPNAFFEVIDWIPSGEWKFWEMYYISLFKSWGFILKNRNGGGSGAHTYSLESRKKMSESHKGQATWNKGKKYSPERCVKMGELSRGNTYRRGRKFGKIEKLSKSKKENFASGKTIPWNKGKKNSQTPWNKGLKGFKHSNEARKKISEAGKGNKYNLGKVHSEEHKKKISEGLKKYHGRKISIF